MAFPSPATDYVGVGLGNGNYCMSGALFNLYG